MTDTQSAIERSAGLFLVESELWFKANAGTTDVEKAEAKRADSVRGRAQERLLEQPAETLADVSAKLAIAIDWLRCECSELTLALLGSLMADLRLMELRAPIEASYGLEKGSEVSDETCTCTGRA